MTIIRLGMNANFAAVRYPEPEVWLRIVGEKLGLRYAQFYLDLCDPSWPAKIRRRITTETVRQAQRFDVRITTLFSGTIAHRLNLFLHPDEDMRLHAINWYEGLIDVAADLGCEGAGSYLGSFSLRDWHNPQRCETILAHALELYRGLTVYARKRGLKYLMLEPMSTPREYPSTIEETTVLYQRVNDGAALPVRLCLDVGHGRVKTGTAEDANPYAWLRRFAAYSPTIHIQQTDKLSSKHLPFTPETNSWGGIVPEKVVAAIQESGAEETLLVLEVDYPAFEPFDDRIVEDLQASVQYWRQYVST
jgi:sugar phosphate isomerase/epimerase